MRILKYLIVLLVLAYIFPAEALAQKRITARGTNTARRVGVHRGNQIRTVFTNFASIARDADQGPRGAWKFDTNGYIGDVAPVIGVRLPVKDYTKDGVPDTVVQVIVTPVNAHGGGDFSPGGKSWTFEPIPGFCNPAERPGVLGKGVAMSNLPDTWPSEWPDYPTWRYTGNRVVIDGVDVTPSVDWNGYFGRAQISADQESYFWMDDNSDERMFNQYGFTPDSTDPSRRGQALQVSVRGLQWNNRRAQNAMFWVYNIKNDGTSIYDQAVFGILVGTYVGCGMGTQGGDEWNDDASFFDVREAITYTWDYEPGSAPPGKGYIRPSANPLWQPNASSVGYVAYGFLESPGNSYDGIDNDGDDRKTSGAAKYFVESDFSPRTVKSGDKLVLINKKTFERSIFTMPNDTVTVQSMGVNFFLQPNVTVLQEGNINTEGTLNPNTYDGIDNNLNGLIDENYLVYYRQYKKSPAGIVLIDTLSPVQYIDYVSGVGKTDRMIDEKRDDGVDNDLDWKLLDDAGLDGKTGSGDFGEGDGKPTSGWQLPGVVPGSSTTPNLSGLVDTYLPGEADIDKTDVDESDQLGLTSFQYFVPSNAITQTDKPDMWRRLKPGYYDVPTTVINNVATKGEDGDFMYGSGYFPLLPGSTENFSLTLCYGDDLKETIKTKQVAQLIYNSNYQFSKPPEKPTLTAIPGDKKVTLVWDRAAESSIDPMTKEVDFEGYKIYKGTDPDFTDAYSLTDGSGQKIDYKPTAQFDLANGVQGYFVASAKVYQEMNGAAFYLGSDNGIKNSYVDNDVVNGRTYYYAVVAYDRGDATKDIFPSENTKAISKDATGKVDVDINTAVVTPNPPVLGYVPPATGKKLDRVIGGSTPVPYFEVVNPPKVKTTTYEVTFRDTLVKGIGMAVTYTVRDTVSKTYPISDNYRLAPSNGDIFDGVRLSFDAAYQKLDSIKINSAQTGWRINNTKPDSVKPLGFTVFQWVDDINKVYGLKYPRDYVLVFNNDYKDSSNDMSSTLKIEAPSVKNINFKIFDVTDKKNIKQIKFLFFEINDAQRDTLSNDDIIVLSDPTGKDISWQIVFGGKNTYVPKANDTLAITFLKPFSSTDKFVFSTNREDYDVNLAKNKLDQIKVVPNPYVVTNIFEQPLPPSIRGRGERVIKFINLPPRAKINIYSSSGDHIRSLEHDGSLTNGTVNWDLRTKEGLDIAYGVYFYVIEADGLGSKKTGKIAVIK